MLRVQGEERFEQAPGVIWNALARPEFLCECFPGVDRVLRADDRSASLVVRPGFAFVRGTMEIAFEFVETEPPRRARMHIHVKGIASSAELETRVELSADGSGTRVGWSADLLQVGGLLKAVSQGLIQGAAEKIARDTWAAVRNRMGKQ